MIKLNVLSSDWLLNEFSLDYESNIFKFSLSLSIGLHNFEMVFVCETLFNKVMSIVHSFSNKIDCRQFCLFD